MVVTKDYFTRKVFCLMVCILASNAHIISFKIWVLGSQVLGHIKSAEPLANSCTSFSVPYANAHVSCEKIWIKSSCYWLFLGTSNHIVCSQGCGKPCRENVYTWTPWRMSCQIHVFEVPIPLVLRTTHEICWDFSCLVLLKRSWYHRIN